jgi:predicted phage terminase large subunit-like protein
MVRRGGFREFVKRAWRQAEPMPLVWGWYHDAIVDHLEAVLRREIRDLVINQPPGTSKSLLASVLYPAYVWTIDPTHRWITASFSDEVTKRDARKCRTLVQGDWYSSRWTDVRIPDDASASKAVGSYYTTAGGMRYSATVRSAVTGQHADTMLVDDPLDPQGAARSSGVELDEVIRWWNETMSTRFRDHKTSARILVMQRLHERDLSAEMIRAGATVLCLPMRYESNHPHRWAHDPRKSDGELLDPVRYPEDVLQRLERTLGPSQTAGQLQQRPAPAGGAIFKEEWFRRLWTVLPPGGSYAQSWDFKAKDLQQSGSYVVGQCWYSVGPNHYLVDQTRKRLGFNDTISEVLAFSARWPQATRKLFESKANGPAIAEVLRSKLAGIELLETGNADKAARAVATEPLWAAGNVYLPHPTDSVYPDGRRGAEWLAEFIAEHLSFPKGANDDQVDTASQYLNAVNDSFVSNFMAAMDRW